MSLAENLEELTLIGDPKAAKKLCATRILGTREWARLRVVYLKWFDASVSELEDFLKRHTLSLRRPTLDEFNLTSGSWEHIGAIIPVMNPALELILGFLSTQNRPDKADIIFPLSSADLDVSGPSDKWYDKVRRTADIESQDDNEEEDQSETASSVEYDEYDVGERELDNLDDLEYSSDDSSPGTDEPRRKRDIDLLDTIDADLRSKVEYLRNKLPGCPVQECLRALAKYGNRDTARRYLKIRLYRT